MARAPVVNLTAKVCQDHANNCRKLAEQPMTPARRVLLEHIAETWVRIAADIRKVKK